MANFQTLKGLVTVVTGGASGLGRATVERFIRQGASVILCDLPTSKGELVANELGEQCIYVPGDVASETDMKNVMNVAETKFKNLHVAVNCAGISVAFKVYNFLKDQPHRLSDFKRIIRTNVSGSYNVSQLAGRLMEKNEPDEDGQKGVIVNTSGTSAFEGLIGQSAFSASARAITSMTLDLAHQFAPHGIRCCAIAPGYMDTPLLGTLPPDLCKFIAETTPFPKRFGKPDEFAHLVEVIIGTTMLNGEVIRLDGGCRMSL